MNRDREKWEVKGLFGNTNNLYQNFSQASNLLPLFGFNLFVCVWKQRWILMGFNLFSSSFDVVFIRFDLSKIFTQAFPFFEKLIFTPCLFESSSSQFCAKCTLRLFLLCYFFLLCSTQQQRWIKLNTNVVYLISSLRHRLFFRITSILSDELSSCTLMNWNLFHFILCLHIQNSKFNNEP